MIERDGIANINQAVCLLRPNDNVVPEYLAYYLQLPSSVDKLISGTSTGAQPNLSLADIRAFKFELPSDIEQQKIVEILSDCDRSIEILTSQILQKEKTLSNWRHRSFISEQKVKLGSLARLLYGKGFKVKIIKKMVIARYLVLGGR